MDIFDRLRQFDILSHFSDEQIEQLAGCSSRARFPKDSTVVQEGDSTKDVYLVDEGSVDIRRKTPFGPFVFATLGCGDVFGETSFVDQSARSGDVTMGEDSVLFCISHAALQMTMERDPRFQLAFYWALWRSLSEKLRRTNETLVEFILEGKSPRPSEGSDHPQATEINVGVGTKRDLFREQKLSNMEINFLATLSKERKYSPEQHIFRDGDDGEEMFIVLEGKVRISKVLDSGEEALGILERGGFFGEMALIDGKPRSADAIAHVDGAVVLAIPRQVLEGILDMKKVSSMRLLSILCNLVAKRLREIDTKLVTFYIFRAGSGETLGIPQL